MAQFISALKDRVFLCHQDKEVCEVTCIDGHENTKTVFECSLEDIVKEVVSASKKIIAKCDKECWESPELDALRSIYDTLLTWNDNEKFR